MLDGYGFPLVRLLDDLLAVFDPPGCRGFRRYVRRWRDVLVPTAPGLF